MKLIKLYIPYFSPDLINHLNINGFVTNTIFNIYQDSDNYTNPIIDPIPYMPSGTNYYITTEYRIPPSAFQSNL